MKNRNLLNHILNFLSVILGVFLAFYVSDVAKAKEEHREGRSLMKSIARDLSSDIKTYEEYQIPVNEKYLVQLDSLLVCLKTEHLPSINSRLPAIFQLENYTPSSATYTSMKSSGKTRLLDDLALQKKLSDYYDGIAIECAKKNDVQTAYFMEELLPWLSTNADLTEMKLSEGGEISVLKNKILIYASLVDQKVENYKMIVEDSKYLHRHLDALISADNHE